MLYISEIKIIINIIHTNFYYEFASWEAIFSYIIKESINFKVKEKKVLIS